MVDVRSTPNNNEGDLDVKGQTEQSNVTYVLNEAILCQYKDGFQYEAKIIKCTDKGYHIHYKGWNKRHDTFVSKANAAQQFQKFDKEVLDESMNARNEALNAGKKKSKRSVSVSSPLPSKKRRSSKVVKEAEAETPEEKEVESTNEKVKHNKSLPLPLPKKKSRRSSVKDESKAKSKSSTKSNQKSAKRVKKTIPPSLKKKPSNVKEESIEPTAEREESLELSTNALESDLPTPFNDHQATTDLDDSIDEFSDLLSKELMAVLIDESTKLNEEGKFPQIPAVHSIESIVEEYLKSKGVDVDKKFYQSITDVPFECAGKCDAYSSFLFMLQLFNATCSKICWYPSEKDKLQDYSADSSIPRLSEEFGITYFLRFVTKMDYVFREYMVDNFVREGLLEHCKEFFKHLDKTIGTYYDKQSYCVQ